jgi:diguanylate cyclase (GGDEF)-like protein
MYLAAGALAVGGYFLLPSQGLAQNIAYNVIGLVSGLAILAAVRLQRPERPGMWYWFGAGQIVWVAGDVIFEIYQYVLDEQPYPSLADAFYLSAYPMLMVGLLLLIHGRRGRDITGLVDAAIVAAGLGLVFWLFVLHPVAADSSASTLERVISTAYPVGDAMLLAMLARLFTSAGTRTPSTRLLGLAALLLLVTDVSNSLATRYSSYDGGIVDAGWLLSYVTWAAAALHPSMRMCGAAAPAMTPRAAGGRRLVVLAACSLLAPAMLFVPHVGAKTGDRMAVGICAVVLFLLVVVRMSGFVAQVQRQAGQLTDLAMQDDLTGLPNRRQFERELHAALAGGVAHVALLDLDGFKNVNDELGHSVGDQLLITLGARLAGVVGAPAFVARMGGDEFAVLIPDATEDAAFTVVHRIVDTLREPVRVGEHELLVGASIGVAAGVDVDEPLEVLRRADIAMYAAKANGEPYRCYEPELDRRTGEEARIGAELRTALDVGQFRLVYQPIVELPHARLVAVEALVRWDHPERGTIGPADFIPIAERNGLIIELGEWILREACLRMAQWRAELGPDAPERISVNVSARQLARPGLADMVALALADSGLPAACLTVEVTETAVFDGGRALNTLHELRASGVRIALDDFGTGHSSLTLLQTVPAHVLKVDKSFIDDIMAAGRHAVIATSLIQVANGLGLAAVAEGVETAEQAAELYRMGYRLAQGYHFGKPAADLPVRYTAPASARR